MIFMGEDLEWFMEILRNFGMICMINEVDIFGYLEVRVMDDLGEG